MHIELGDDGRYSTKGICIVTYKRESGSHIHFKDVMYVPGLNKNLIYVAVLEDHGYVVVLSKWEAFLRHVVILMFGKPVSAMKSPSSILKNKVFRITSN